MKIFPIILLVNLLLVGPSWGCGNIQLEDGRILEAPPGAGVLAGYLTLHNPSDQDLKLTRADSPDFALVEFHSISQDEATLRMKPEKELTIPAHDRLVFSPGKLHMMLFRPERDFRLGDSVKINLYCGSDSRAITLIIKSR